MQLSEKILLLTSIGVTQKEIAEAIPCTQPTVSYNMNPPPGRKPKPSAQFVQGIESLFKKYSVALARAEETEHVTQ